MIFQVVLSLSFAAVVLGDGCCAPEKWEGEEMLAGGFTSKSGKKGSIRSGFKISYDAVGQRVAVSGRSRRNETEFKHIYNFKEKKAYIIYPKSQECKVADMEKAKFPKACIPDDARKFGSSFLGAGDNTLSITAYGISAKGAKFAVEGVATVTSVGCIPVSEDWWGMVRGAGFFTNVNFAGITPGIQDETVFSPPEYCEEGHYEWLKKDTDFRVLRMTTIEMIDS